MTGSEPIVGNDSVDALAVQADQSRPSIAAVPGGAVAVAFYDRRSACPSDPSVLPADAGRTNFCIDASLQTYKDMGSGAVSVGANRRLTQYAWHPEHPGQHLRGLSQDPCARARGRRATG